MKNGIIFSRVSTPKQNHERQLSELHAFARNNGINVVAAVTETGSGCLPYEERACLKGVEAMIRLGAANTLLCIESSRISRSMDVAKSFLTEIAGKAEVVLLSEGLSFLNFEKLDIFERSRLDMAFLYAEKEAEFIGERVRSGMESAKRRGVHIGRPKGSVYSEDQMLNKYSEIVECIKRGVSWRKTARMTGKSLATVKRVIDVLKGKAQLQEV